MYFFRTELFTGELIPKRHMPSLSVITNGLYIVVTLAMTAQTMSFRYELACKEFSTEKAHYLVT